MNIAFVLSYLEDQFGGPVTAVKRLGHELADMGHQVSYWAPGDSGGERRGFAGPVNVYPYGWPRSWRRSRGLIRGLSSAIDSIDVVHASELWLHSTYAASRIAAAHGVPYILRPAGCLEPWRLNRGPLKSLKKRLYLRLLGRSFLDQAACLEAASVQEAESFRLARCQGPVAVVPHGIGKEFFDDYDPSDAEVYWPGLKDRPVVLFMSRLSPEKGLNLLIPLWAELVKAPAYRDAILVIAGPDYRGYGKTVEKMIRQNDVASHVLVTGMVRGHPKQSLLRRSDLFVLPSYSENFGIVVAEALATGTPVVTTTGTPWEQVKKIDAGRWVTPDVASLGEALGELLTMSESQRRAMGRRGRELVEAEYSWECVSRKFLALCDGVRRGRPLGEHHLAASVTPRVG